MNQTDRSSRVVRSVCAVLAGFLVVVVPSIAADAARHATGIFPPPGEPKSHWLFLLAMAYRIVFGVAGGYVAAWLAPDRPMLHALALGAIGLVLGSVGAVMMWDAGPAWYSLAIVAIAIPCAWAGAKLRGAGT